ncbi:MAG: hypothetical protein GVY19_11360 [Bacteroidetes bacterium]|nr:hypothetical protein [Bacteroidota bacterium]
MKNLFLTVCMFFVLCITIFAQTTTIEKTFQPFTSVKAYNGVLVELVPSDTFRAEINYKNIEVQQIITRVENNNLIIKIDGNMLDREDVFIKLYFKELYRVEAYSNAEVTCEETIQQEHFALQVKSSGEIYLNLDVQELNGNAVEGGIVHLQGSARNVKFETSTKGAVDAFDLTALHADLQVNLGGSIKMTVEESLKARATMNGVISYKGKPAINTKKISLGGQLNHLNE